MQFGKRFLIFILAAGLCHSVFAQTAATALEFLEQPTSARVTALGGANISLESSDINFVFQNPALLGESMTGALGLNYALAYAGIMYGTAAYAFNIDTKNYLSIGAQYVDYGSMTETDELNNTLGNFTAKDMALYLSYSRLLAEGLKIGVALKPVFQAWERKTSFALGADVGLHYVLADKNFSAGLTFRNIGAQIVGFESEQTGEYRENLPLNIEAGISWKLQHAPLRFSLTLHNLQQWDFPYANREKEPNFADKAFRHAIISIELTPSEKFFIAAGYNRRRAAELSMADFKSMAGFSLGAGIKISRFQVAFGMGNFLKGNSLYHFSLATSLESFGL